jgi:hypothetical protein
MGELRNLDQLGAFGVNLTKNPLKHTDGEFARAQNWEAFREEGRLGIRKRFGLQRLNGSALAGTVGGFMAVPLAAPNARRLWVAGHTNPPTAWFSKLVADAAFDAGDSIPGGVDVQNTHQTLTTAVPLVRAALSYKGRIYFPADSPRGGLYAFDGTTAYRVTQFLSAGAIEWIFTGDDAIFCCVTGTGGLSNYVYRVDPVTGDYTTLCIGSSFVAATENLICGCWWLGELWIGSTRSGGSSARLHRAKLSDSAYTVGQTAAASQSSYTSLCAFQGSLYAATAASAGTAALIQKRTPDGTVTTSLTGTSSANANFFDALFVFNSELYAVYTNSTAGVLDVYKFDGSSWSVDKDLAALAPAQVRVRGYVVAANRLYLVTLDGSNVLYGLERTTAGVWSSLDNIDTVGAIGLIGAI